MEILTEFDILQEAMKKINLDEEVMPFIRGRIVENTECYNKMKLILNSPEMIKSHKFVLNLDAENLTEEEVDKVNRLYDLGLQRGFIEQPISNNDLQDVQDNNPQDEIIDQTASQDQPKAIYKAKIPAWTILYSAWKDGTVKSGECYSNAINVISAKADAFAKLSKCGYENINILAIEAGDPDCCGCEQAFEADENVIEKDKEVTDEEVKNAENAARKAIADKTVSDIENESEDIEEMPLDEASGNPYLQGMKTNNIGGVSSISSKNSTAKKTAIKEKDDSKSDSKDKAKEVKKDTSTKDSAEDKKEKEPIAKDKEDKEPSKKDEASETQGDEDQKDDQQDDESFTDFGLDDNKEDASASKETNEPDQEGSSEEDKELDDARDEKSDKQDDISTDDKKEQTDKEELPEEKRVLLKNDFKKAFKQIMLNCKFEDKCFDDLTIEEKVKFFTELGKTWTKNQPQEFMTDKEMEQLNKTVMTK